MTRIFSIVIAIVVLFTLHDAITMLHDTLNTTTQTLIDANE